MRHLPHILLPLLAMLLLASCAEDDGIDGRVEMPLTEIVSFEGNDDGKARFTFRKVDDTPLVTLVADRGLDPGDMALPVRMLLTYVPDNGKPYESGPIRMLSAARINCAPVETVWKDGYDLWQRDGVYVYSMWRSGTYINLRVRLTYSTEPRTFCLAVMPQTLDTPWPELCLVHVMEPQVDYHDRAYYASFDIASVWNRPDVEGVRIHVANTNLDKHIFTFPKGYRE